MRYRLQQIYLKYTALISRWPLVLKQRSKIWLIIHSKHKIILCYQQPKSRLIEKKGKNANSARRTWVFKNLLLLHLHLQNQSTYTAVKVFMILFYQHIFQSRIFRKFFYTHVHGSCRIMNTKTSQRKSQRDLLHTFFCVQNANDINLSSVAFSKRRNNFLDISVRKMMYKHSTTVVYVFKCGISVCLRQTAIRMECIGN